jgi:hypothetical protein
VLDDRTNKREEDTRIGAQTDSSLAEMRGEGKRRVKRRARTDNNCVSVSC